MGFLTLEDVTLRFGGSRAGATASPAVLEKVSIEVKEKEFLTVLGPSGCGKTTLLRLIAGFERPTHGRIVFQGKEITKPSSERVVVFQQPWLYPWLSLRENVAFGLKIHSRRVDWAKVDQMIEVVGLTGFSKHPPYHLSGGMQQRAALARALVMSPKILLMDEPFGALDAQTRQLLQEFLLGLWEKLDVTVVFITHDVEEAILLGDRMLVMGTRPGCIALELPINIPRPRDEATTLTPEFLAVRRQALDTLREVALAASGITGTQHRDGKTRQDRSRQDRGGEPAEALAGGEARALNVIDATAKILSSLEHETTEVSSTGP